MSVFTTNSEIRKKHPVFHGVLDYFPDAIAAVSNLSYAGNKKHNNGQSLVWSRDKSADHKDCIVRHLMDGDYIELAWRALALAQLKIEEQKEEGSFVLPSDQYEKE